MEATGAPRPVRTKRPTRRAAGGQIVIPATAAASTKRPGRRLTAATKIHVSAEAAERSASHVGGAKRRRTAQIRSPRARAKKKTQSLRLDPCPNRGGKRVVSKLQELTGASSNCSPDDNNRTNCANNLLDDDDGDDVDPAVACARTDLLCPPDNNWYVPSGALTLPYRSHDCDSDPICRPRRRDQADYSLVYRPRKRDRDHIVDDGPAGLIAKRVLACHVDLPCPPGNNNNNNNWRDWANLADGPAGLIAERVLAYDVADYVRFRAVCRPWRHSSTEPRWHSGLDRRFHPWRWAMLREELAAPDRRSFLNISTGQYVHVDIPELCDHDLLALTPEGLLVLVHKPQRSTVRLLNPLTRQLTELPPLTTLLPPNQHDILSQYDIHTYCQAWGSGIASDDSTVVLCFNRLRMLGMAKPGDDHWTVLKYNGHGMTTAPLMFAGRFYCVNLSGVMALDMGADQPPQLKVAAKLSMPVSPMVDSVHLVNNSGELVLVHRQCGPQKARNKSGRSYNIYRVDLDTGTLFPVKSLGGSAGRAVFMGMRCSLSVSLEFFPSGSISADTIYLSFDVCERQQFKVGAYHLIDGNMERMNSGGLVPRPYTLADCLSYAVEGL